MCKKRNEDSFFFKFISTFDLKGDPSYKKTNILLTFLLVGVILLFAFPVFENSFEHIVGMICYTLLLALDKTPNEDLLAAGGSNNTWSILLMILSVLMETILCMRFCLRYKAINERSEDIDKEQEDSIEEPKSINN